MNDKDFNKLVSDLSTVNKKTAMSVIEGTDPILSLIRKINFRFSFGTRFLFFKLKNIYLYTTLMKHPEKFILRAFYRYFARNKTFMIKPEPWLMTLVQLPSFITHGDHNHQKMKLNRFTKKEKKKMIRFCADYYHYYTISNLLKMSDIKETLLRKKASQIIQVSKLMMCQEDESSSRSGNVPEDYVRQLLK